MSQLANTHSSPSLQISDALNLRLEAASVDLLFSNWLLMYLSDVETVTFLRKALIWLKPGGHL